MPSRFVIGVLVALAASGCARRGGVLHVESATIDFPAETTPDAAGRLELRARFSGLRLDPADAVRLDVGQSARWVRLAPVVGREDVWSVEGLEHGYRMTLDLATGTVTAVEPDVAPARDNPVLIGLAQNGRTACVHARFETGGDRWTFDGTRDAQEPCRPR